MIEGFDCFWGGIWGAACLLAILCGALWVIRQRLRERSEHRALEKAHLELEAHVQERTIELQHVNQQLQREIDERLRAEAALRKAHDALELRMVERTRELQTVQENLQQREEQLRQAQKLEAIGQMAGGIAHDFNNQLAIIRGYVDMAIEQIPDTSGIYSYLNSISEAVQRSTRLTHQLLIFSSKQPVEQHPLDLNLSVRAIQDMLGRLLGEDIAIRLQLSENLWPTVADSGNIDQVITNLCVNARDAMPKGGALTIATANVDLQENDLHRHPDAKPGRYVCLSISDTGVGMDENVKTHLFEPFFTTKGPGKGTGLGLAVVYGIIQSHKGWIKVTSAPKKGSTFEIFLPAHNRAESETGAAPELEENRFQGHGECILLIEDEAALRNMKQEILHAQNYRVLACATCAEARACFDAHANDIDLIFSDVVLPDGRGPELAAEWIDRRPNLPIILVTGYTDERADLDRVQKHGWPLLRKPLTVQQLLDSIHDALGAR